MKLKIEVKPENKYIPLILSDKVKISIKRLNPMFHRQGSYSLPFSIPACTHNDAILSFPNRIQQSSIKEINIPFKLYFDGLLQLAGHCMIEKSNELVYEANLVVDIGNFVSTVAGKKLSDLNMGGERRLFTEQQNWDLYIRKLCLCVNGSWPEYEYTLFPFYAPTFYEYSEIKVANEWDGYKQILKHSNFTLFPYLCTILKYIFFENGYLIRENIFESDQELKKLVAYNNYNEDFSQQKFSLNKFTPDSLITDFIWNIQQRFNVTFFVNDILKEVNILKNNAVILNPVYLDITGISGKEYEILHKK
jgi:hypothetical protein